MITYTNLDKRQKGLWLPRLFDLYYTNMNPIAPSGLSCEEEQAQWLSAVSPALEKAPRQILLCLSDLELAGYVQYYTRDDMLMIEELQLCPGCQGSTVFLSLIKALIRTLPEGICYVEAYAHSCNCRSIALMHRLGMEALPHPDDSPFVHFRGSSGSIKTLFIR